MAQPRHGMLHIRRSISRLSHVWQWQIVILGPLEWRNHFGPSNKLVYLKMLVFQSTARFLILFVLMDAILLKLDLQKRTSVLGNPPNRKLFVYQKCIIYAKIGNVFLISNMKSYRTMWEVNFYSFPFFDYKIRPKESRN